MHTYAFPGDIDPALMEIGDKSMNYFLIEQEKLYFF